MTILDISQEVSPAIAVWPGDTRFQTHKVMQMSDGDSCDVGTITMSVHTGTHADAPGHYVADGPGIADVTLAPYIGPARVIATTPKGLISADDLQAHELSGVERVLIKTGTAPNPDHFNTDFAGLSEDAAAYLVQTGMRLVGLDTPSMDAFDSKRLPAHKRLRSSEIAILENLWLTHVEPGDYELVALPLKLKGLDASPVRAVLLTR